MSPIPLAVKVCAVDQSRLKYSYYDDKSDQWKPLSIKSSDWKPQEPYVSVYDPKERAIYISEQSRSNSVLYKLCIDTQRCELLQLHIPRNGYHEDMPHSIGVTDDTVHILTMRKLNRPITTWCIRHIKYNKNTGHHTAREHDICYGQSSCSYDHESDYDWHMVPLHATRSLLLFSGKGTSTKFINKVYRCDIDDDEWISQPIMNTNFVGVNFRKSAFIKSSDEQHVFIVQGSVLGILDSVCDRIAVYDVNQNMFKLSSIHFDGNRQNVENISMCILRDKTVEYFLVAGYTRNYSMSFIPDDLVKVISCWIQI